jgi:endonuclease/exonuclease/phosphatase (EEP) superfamily protein YafD
VTAPTPLADPEQSTTPTPQTEPVRGRASSAAWLFAALAAAAAQMLVFQFVRRIVWFGDVIAIGVPVLTAAAVLVALVLAAFRRWGALLVAATMVVAGVGVSVGPRLPQSSGEPVDPIELMSINLRYDNPVRGQALAAVAARKPEVVVVSELTRMTDSALARRYEHQAHAWGEANGMGIFSSVPFERVDVEREFPELGRTLREQLVIVRFEQPEPFLLVATHPPRPVFDYKGNVGTSSFEDHRQAIEQLDDLADSAGIPVVIAGDLNLSDRARGYEILADGRRDVARAGTWAQATYDWEMWGLLQLRIDYVFIPDAWCADDSELVSIPGSDHKAVTAHVGPCV